VRVGGREARAAATDVVVREVLKGALLVAVRPLTGRRHQVRVHLAHAGLPILGVDFRSVGSGEMGPVTADLRARFEEILRGRNPKYAKWIVPVPQTQAETAR
jgi:23S rRNA-/tRNA-specific pseudouridylate synthase